MRREKSVDIKHESVRFKVIIFIPVLGLLSHFMVKMSLDIDIKVKISPDMVDTRNMLISLYPVFYVNR